MMPKSNKILDETEKNGHSTKKPSTDESLDPILENAVSSEQFNTAETASEITDQAYKILEEGKRLSESILFELLKDYYARQGPYAWLNGTPNFITSSTFIAEAYAELIITFLLENLDSLDMNEPVYILELATGIGRLSFFLLQELERKQKHFSQLKNLKLIYIMSDFTNDHVDFWHQHEMFQPYLKSEALDFATFNPLKEVSIHLRIANKQLTQGDIKNPLLAISNYFFDTISHDIFLVKDKKLYEGLTRITDTNESIETTQEDTPVDFRKLDLMYDYQPIDTPEQYYHCPTMNKVLNSYIKDIDEGTLIFPVGGFRVIENLLKLSDRQIFLLLSDKAFTDVECMSCSYETHNFITHGGSFSFMVNIDAIGRYFHSLGGHYRYTDNQSHSLQTSCLQLHKNCSFQNEKLNYVFEEYLKRNNKICSLLDATGARSLATDDNKFVEVQTIISKMELALLDPYIFSRLNYDLLDAMGSASIEQKQTLLKIAEKVKNMHYYYPGADSFYVELALLYVSLEKYEESNECLDLEMKIVGVDTLLLLIKAENFEALDDNNNAIKLYQQILSIDDAIEKHRESAQEGLKRLAAFKDKENAHSA